MRLFTPAVARRVPWKNGLGATIEIATDAAAPGGEWTWRLSIADVPSPAQFSAFPGVDRFIACLAGPGLHLEHGEPLGPGVRDVNLMLRRDRWRGCMTLARGRALALDAPLVLIHLTENSPILRVAAAEGACELAPGHTLAVSGRVEISGAPGSVVVACELTPSGPLL
jgi:environmental stress-induced protein Ves